MEATAATGDAIVPANMPEVVEVCELPKLE